MYTDALRRFMLDSDSKNASQGECEVLVQNAIEGSGSYVLGTGKCRSSNISGANDYKQDAYKVWLNAVQRVGSKRGHGTPAPPRKSSSHTYAKVLIAQTPSSS